MDKQKVVDGIIAYFNGRLEKLPAEKEAALSTALPQSRATLEQGYEGQQKALQDALAVVGRVPGSVKPGHSVSEGSLIRVRLEQKDGKVSKAWWLILSRISGKADPVTVDGEEIVVKNAYAISRSLVGTRAGDKLEVPPVHGDARDVLASVTIEEIL